MTVVALGGVVAMLQALPMETCNRIIFGSGHRLGRLGKVGADEHCDQRGYCPKPYDHGSKPEDVRWHMCSLKKFSFITVLSKWYLIAKTIINHPKTVISG